MRPKMRSAVITLLRLPAVAVEAAAMKDWFSYSM